MELIHKMNKRYSMHAKKSFSQQYNLNCNCTTMREQTLDKVVEK